MAKCYRLGGSLIACGSPDDIFNYILERFLTKLGGYVYCDVLFKWSDSRLSVVSGGNCNNLEVVYKNGYLYFNSQDGKILFFFRVEDAVSASHEVTVYTQKDLKEKKELAFLQKYFKDQVYILTEQTIKRTISDLMEAFDRAKEKYNSVKLQNGISLDKILTRGDETTLEKVLSISRGSKLAEALKTLQTRKKLDSKTIKQLEQYVFAEKVVKKKES
ncbi:MAG: hypothetical protein QXY76_03280 [Nitrososphaeria archaeon]